MKHAIVALAFILVASLGYSQKEKELTLNKDTNLIEATYYHENGEISQKGTFDLAGKLHGEWTSFDKVGEKVSMGNYERGIRTGKWYFWSDGTLKEVEFDNNVIASVINKETAGRVATKN